MTATLAEIKTILEQILADLPALIQRSQVTPTQIVVGEGLSDISRRLGLIMAGEFRAGNSVEPGLGFSGVRIGYPAFSYSSELWNIVGINDDALQVGIRASDGKLVAGGGVVTADDSGITITTPADFEDVNAYKFSVDGAVKGGLYARELGTEFEMELRTLDSTEGRSGQLNLSSSAVDQGIVNIQAAASDSGKLAQILLTANAQSVITISADSISFNGSSGSLVAAETNANDIFSVTSPGGPSLWTGTISGAPSGTSVTVSAPLTGTEAVLVPTSTSQLAKMRLYNTTRGNSALISNYNTGTNVVTLTATVPANWANGDSLTIASQTVSGGGFNWIDLEITSGPTSKRALFFLTVYGGGAVVGDSMRLHPLSAFSASKYSGITLTQAAGTNNNAFGLVALTSNVFSLTWTNTPSQVVVREQGYIA